MFMLLQMNQFLYWSNAWTFIFRHDDCMKGKAYLFFLKRQQISRVRRDLLTRLHVAIHTDTRASHSTSGTKLIISDLPLRDILLHVCSSTAATPLFALYNTDSSPLADNCITYSPRGVHEVIALAVSGALLPPSQPAWVCRCDCV